VAGDVDVGGADLRSGGWVGEGLGDIYVVGDGVEDAVVDFAHGYA
jgi:hypothetical protein